jgi:hypothetical protein
MTKREIAALACRILGICLVFIVLVSAPIYYPMVLARYGETPVAWTAASIIAPLAILFLVGLLLWFKADWIAARMTRNGGTPATASHLTSRALWTVAASILGLYLLSQTLPYIGYYAVYTPFTLLHPPRPMHHAGGDSHVPVYVVARMHGHVAGSITEVLVKLALGLVLLLKSDWLLRFVKLPRQPTEPES